VDSLQIVFILICFNVTLSGMRYILEKYKDKTETDLDNFAYEIINKILTLLDWVMTCRGGDRGKK